MNAVINKKLSAVERMVVTEKSVGINDRYGKVTLYVARSMTKKQIKSALAEIFGWRVLRVNTMIESDERRINRRGAFVERGKKKAIVTIEGGFRFSAVGA